jgi:hypothetical protein
MLRQRDAQGRAGKHPQTFAVDNRSAVLAARKEA